MDKTYHRHTEHFSAYYLLFLLRALKLPKPLNTVVRYCSIPFAVAIETVLRLYDGVTNGFKDYFEHLRTQSFGLKSVTDPEGSGVYTSTYRGIVKINGNIYGTIGVTTDTGETITGCFIDKDPLNLPEEGCRVLYQKVSDTEHKHYDTDVYWFDYLTVTNS